MLGILFTLPDASTTLASVGAYSSPIMTDLLPIAILGIGVFLGFFIVQFLIGAVAGAFHK